MRIVTLLGSPRPNGNSATIAKHFCDTAERFGGEVKTFLLNTLEYRGCQGCMMCKTKLDQCVLEDDLTQVLDAIRGSDILVLASPVYFWDVSGQLKTFIDRTYSYLVPDFKTKPIKSRLAPGKKLVLILAQGNPDESMFTNIFPKFDFFFRMNGFNDTHSIRACGVQEPGEVRNQLGVIGEAEALAEKLCKKNKE